MNDMRRRDTFLAPLAAAFPAMAADAAAGDPQSVRIFASGDGISRTPAEYSALLAKLTADDRIEPDSYSLGGVVEKLEKRMAQLLGKEAAVWLPTGTLANQLAIRLLCGTRHHALVQAESHLYRDCGDCMQTLSGINLIPLAPGRATFNIDTVEEAANDAQLGRVLTPIGAIQIETPVRRQQGQQFEFEQMKKISAWARERKVGMHLDGARLFIASAYAKRPVTEYTALFDTVYVSMWKYFNAASGAILAGPAPLLEGLYHTRRMFGGSLPHSWPLAAVALYTLDGFEDRFRKAVETSEVVLKSLSGNPNFEIRRFPGGTNVFQLKTVNVNSPVYQLRLETAGITAARPVNEWLTLQVNETWNRLPAPAIYERFVAALG